jgi:crotonobetainyl-CoA:carnitine CoA-transferase CaiB-like acyl-CoA transferase
MADHHSLKLTAERRGIIIERLALGDMLKDICDDIGVNRSNVYRMTQRDKEFGELYDRAHLTGIEAFLEEARATLATAANRDEILRAKELLRHAEWRAEKLLIRYQPTQKSEVKHSGPMIIGWESEAKAEPAKIVSDVELDYMTNEDVAN